MVGCTAKRPKLLFTCFMGCPPGRVLLGQLPPSCELRTYFFHGLKTSWRNVRRSPCRRDVYRAGSRRSVLTLFRRSQIAAETEDPDKEASRNDTPNCPFVPLVLHGTHTAEPSAGEYSPFLPDYLFTAIAAIIRLKEHSPLSQWPNKNLQKPSNQCSVASGEQHIIKQLNPNVKGNLRLVTMGRSGYATGFLDSASD